MNKKGIINISGVSESCSAPIISDIVKEEGQSLIVTATFARANKLASFFFFAKGNLRASGRRSGLPAL